MAIYYIILVLFLGITAHSQNHSQHTPSLKLDQKTEPTKKNEEQRTAVNVPIEQQKKIGLKTIKAEKKKTEHVIRTVGTITADQTKEAHVHTKIIGWIERIYADYIGKSIKKGQPLFELYSPDLVSTQEEYLAAKRQGGATREIALTAIERLKLWGVPQSEIERLKKTGKAKRSITFESPVNGFIIKKTAINGMYITPEMELYHIADLSKVWIIVTLYEYDVAVISVGDEALIQLPYDPEKSFKGKVSYIYPEIDIATRTAKARIEIGNPDQTFKPGMFANIELKKKLGESIIIPDDAVIDTGARKIVFVKTGPDIFEPREIKTGTRIENHFAVLSGLKVGEEVVTSANFLIDAESKFQAAIHKGSPTSSGHSEHEKK